MNLSQHTIVFQNTLRSLVSIERYFDMFSEVRLYSLADQLEVKSSYSLQATPIMYRLDTIWRIAFECWNYSLVKDYTEFMAVNETYQKKLDKKEIEMTKMSDVHELYYKKVADLIGNVGKIGYVFKYDHIFSVKILEVKYMEWGAGYDSFTDAGYVVEYLTKATQPPSDKHLRHSTVFFDLEELRESISHGYEEHIQHLEASILREKERFKRIDTFTIVDIDTEDTLWR